MKPRTKLAASRRVIESRRFFAIARALVPLALAAVPTTTFAAELNGAGQLDVSSALFSLGFESTTATNALSLYSRRTPLTGEALLAHFVTDPDQAIEGSGMLVVGNDALFGQLAFSRIGDLTPFDGRRVELRFWQRAKGTRISASLDWYVSALGAQDPTFLGSVPFQPTGRATDDGWEEWSTGPVDFLMAGRVRPTVLSFHDAQLDAFTGPGARDTESIAWMDALTIDDLGPALVPDTSCSLPTEQSTCGDRGACMYGRCVDAAVAVGPVLESPALRRDYLHRRMVDYAHLEGGRAPIARMATFRHALSALEDETSTVRFWTGLARAVQDLGDPHASAPTSGTFIPYTAGVCLHLGEADLLRTGGLAPLVFTKEANAIGNLLQHGDALVAIDGRTVSEWTVHAARFFQTFGDQEANQLTHTPDLFTAALATGAVLTFDRPLCGTRSSTITAPVVRCPASQVQRVTVDLGAMMDGIWSGQVPSWLTMQSVQCDFRFHAAFPAPDGAVYDFAGTSDIDGVRYLQVNGVPGPYDQAGQAWFDTVSQAYATPAPKMILDERLGDGGTLEAVDHLVSPLLGEQDFDVIHMITQLSQPFDETILGGLASCTPNAFEDACGDYIQQRLGIGNAAHGRARNTRLAVLIGLDVSGNDYVTKLLTYRPEGTTRIFGGAPTLGGYGVIWTLPATPFETSGGSIQIMDTLFRASPDDLNTLFLTSTGVSPDERVFQKQSDAVRDVDTVIAAATRWLNQ